MQEYVKLNDLNLSVRMKLQKVNDWNYIMTIKCKEANV